MAGLDPVADALVDISIAVDKTPLDAQPLAKKPDPGDNARALAALADATTAEILDIQAMEPDQAKAEQATVKAEVRGQKALMAYKAQAHLDAISALTGGAGCKFVRDGITVVVETAPAALYDKESNLVGIEARAVAYDANGQQLSAGDGIHRVVNPPLTIHAGTAHEEERALPNGGTETAKVENRREDPIAAMQAWLFDSVTDTARGLGWKP